LNGTFNGVEQKFKDWMEDELMADKLIIYGKVG